ncbi:MAG: hypothetical protein EB127_19545, partial [Alphaproteobacteria bacterium]|nr:hypothetical protein [Alphaproteobacteria bacterium]
MPEYPPVIYFSNKTDADSASVSGDIYTALAASKTYVVGHTDPLFFSFHHAALDTSGNMYVPDTWNHVIRKIVISTGVVSTLAGTGQQGYVDGSGNLAKFSAPEGIVYDNSGNLYVADSSNSVIRKIVISSAQVSTFAGTPGQQGYADGSGNLAQFSYPSGITLDTSGNMYVSDAGNTNRIRKIVISTAVVSTLAGSGQYGYEDGSGNLAQFANPFGIVYDNSGNLYVADTNNGAIRKIVISTGEVSTFAGTGAGGYVNGSGNLAQFNRSEGIAYDNSGNLYVADGNNQRIRKIVISSGQVSTLTGSGQQGYLDGSGNLAQFNYPRGVVYDNSGNLYVFESGIYAIRKVVISTGEVSTFAGMPDLRGYADTNMVIPTKWKISPSSTGTGDQSYVWNNGTTLSPATGIYFLYPMPSGSVCFLQGTTVLCSVNGYDMYVPVEELTKDSLVKTLLNG